MHICVTETDGETERRGLGVGRCNGKGRDWGEDRKPRLTETQTKRDRGRARGRERRGACSEPGVKEWSLGAAK